MSEIEWLFSKLNAQYPEIKLTIFGDGSGSWYQAQNELTGNELIEIDFDNKEEMISKVLKLIKPCQK